MPQATTRRDLIATLPGLAVLLATEPAAGSATPTAAPPRPAFQAAQSPATMGNSPSSSIRTSVPERTMANSSSRRCQCLSEATAPGSSVTMLTPNCVSPASSPSRSDERPAICAA